MNSAVELACCCVKDLFGDATELVARFLCSKGSGMTLGDIIRSMGSNTLNAAQIKQAILVLIQHNLVFAAMVHPEETRVPRPPYYTYHASIAWMLQIPRYPFMQLQVRDEIGEEAEMVVAALMEAGRLTLDQLVLAVQSKLKANRAKLSAVKEESTQQPGGGIKEDKGATHDSTSVLTAPETKETIRALMSSLASSGYIERAPPCSLPPPLVTQHPASIKGRRGAAAKAGSLQAANEQSAALRSLRSSYENNRFSVLSNTQSERGGGGGGGKGIRVKREAEEEEAGGGPGGRSAKKRKTAGGEAQVVVESNERGLASSHIKTEEGEGDVSTVLWRVNVAEFVRRSRAMACIELVGSKLGKDAGAAMAAILEAVRLNSPSPDLESIPKEDRSVPATMEEIVSCATRMMADGRIQSTVTPSRFPYLIR